MRDVFFFFPLAVGSKCFQACMNSISYSAPDTLCSCSFSSSFSFTTSDSLAGFVEFCSEHARLSFSTKVVRATILQIFRVPFL